MTTRTRFARAAVGLLAGSAMLSPGALAAGTPTYRLVGEPIIAGTPGVHGSTSYVIAFRLNRAIPRNAGGRIEGAVAAAPGGTSASTLGTDARHCYVGRATLRSYTAGRRYAFRVTIGPVPLHPTSKLKGEAVVRPQYHSLRAALAGLAKGLGC